MNVSLVAFLLVFLAVCLFVSVAVLLVVACVAVWLSGWLAGWLGVLLPLGVQGCVFKLDEICPFQSQPSRPTTLFRVSETGRCICSLYKETLYEETLGLP